MNAGIQIRLAAEYDYQMIPLDRIRVLNSRNRDKGQFQENIRSIDAVGLLKPIVVRERHLKTRKHYDLICGEGRYLAYKSLGKTHIPADVITCTEKRALVLSLVENIARVPPGTMQFAREIKRMHDAGCDLVKIAEITGKSETYIRDYIRLVERGEDRLIKGVEQGVFPISFAIRVAQSSSTEIQKVLRDAYDAGIANCSNLATIKKIVNLRMNRGKSPEKDKSECSRYTMKKLKTDIAKVTKEKGSFVQEATFTQNRLFRLLDGLSTLCKDKTFADLLKEEQLSECPTLRGNYDV
jgi:ParB family chromosome partitioning protein